jgi:hypothetical protein
MSLLIFKSEQRIILENYSQKLLPAMKMRFTCPHCNQAVSAVLEQAGKTVRCRKCRQRFTSPFPGEALLEAKCMNCGTTSDFPIPTSCYACGGETFQSQCSSHQRLVTSPCLDCVETFNKESAATIRRRKKSRTEEKTSPRRTFPPPRSTSDSDRHASHVPLPSSASSGERIEVRQGFLKWYQSNFDWMKNWWWPMKLLFHFFVWIYLYGWAWIPLLFLLSALARKT